VVKACKAFGAGGAAACMCPPAPLWSDFTPFLQSVVSVQLREAKRRASQEMQVIAKSNARLKLCEAGVSRNAGDSKKQRKVKAV